MENGYFASLLDPRLHLGGPGGPGGPGASSGLGAGGLGGASHHLSSLAAAAAAASWPAHAPGLGMYQPPSSALSRPLSAFPHVYGSSGGGHGLMHDAHLVSSAQSDSHNRAMAELHRSLAMEQSRKEAVAKAYLSQTRAETLFSHGLPPLDRGGLFPPHGGIMDPLSTTPPIHKPMQASSAFMGGASFFKPPQMDSSSPDPAAFRSFSTPPQKQAQNLTAGAAAASALEAEALSFPRQAGPPAFAATDSQGATNLVTKGASSSAMSSTSNAGIGATAAVASPEGKPVDACAEEDEEVLVDDFDGECCRTYAYNHSRIVRWQKEREERKKAAAAQQQHHHNQASKKTGSSSSSSSSKGHSARKSPSGKLSSSASGHSGKSSGGTTSGSTGSIPVGIAIGRQRQQEERRPDDPVRCAPSASVGPSSAGSTTSGPSSAATDKFDLALPSAATPASLHPGLGSAWPPSPLPSPWSIPPGPSSAGGAFPSVPPWMAAAAGSSIPPIPMGYQLAKDPLTGQILLIPTDGSPRTHTPSLWPFDVGGAAGGLASSFPHHSHFGLPPPANPAAAAQAHYHSLYLQHTHNLHQYLQQQQQQQDLLRPALGAPPSAASAASAAPKTKLPSAEPETITVSDDDDVREDKRASSSASVSPKKRRVSSSSSHKSDAPVVKAEKPDLSVVRSSTPADDASDAKPPKVNSEEIALPAATIKSEPVSFTDSLSSTNDCVAALLELAQESKVAKFEDPESTCDSKSGLSLLLQGIEIEQSERERLATASPNGLFFAELSGLEMLCSATKSDSLRLGVSESTLSIDLLCYATRQEYVAQMSWVDPLVLLKQRYFLHYYKSAESEAVSKQFILDKIRQFGKESHDIAESYEGIRSLAKVVQQIRHTDIMSRLEVELRTQLEQLQETYREKQREVSRWKSSPRKRKLGDKGSRRGPGRPKKRKLKSKGKSKMGRPRKQPQSPDRAQDGDDHEDEDDDLSPPVLEPCASAAFGPKSEAPKAGSLLKPPKLTASLSPPPSKMNPLGPLSVSTNSVTNLSTINERFMKGKPSPFANLMRLTSVSGAPAAISPSQSRMSVINEEEEDEEGKDEEKNSLSERNGFTHSEGHAEEEEFEVERSSDDDEDNDLPAFREGASSGTTASSKCKSSDPEDNSASKKRKAEKPRKHTGSTETIVPKKPKNLFMMNCLNLQRGFKTASAAAAAAAAAASSITSCKSEDGYDSFEEEDVDEEFNDDEDDSDAHKKSSDSASTSKPASAMSCKATTPLFGDKSWSPASTSRPQQTKARRDSASPSGGKGIADGHKTSKSVKAEKEPEKTKIPSVSLPQNALEMKTDVSERTAQLIDADLKDGLRILMLQEGRFWPAKVSSTQLPDVYAVTIEKQRGNRPMILPRDDVLKEAIMEVHPDSLSELPVGTRVCVYWSQAYNCLFPGTVEQFDMPFKEGMVQVLLDDGDRRQVDVANVRLLPPNYSHVVYDPDPISSLRRRRVSNDSVDSGSSDHRLQALACRTTFSSLTTTQSQLAALSPGSGFASGPESYLSPKKPRSAEKALPGTAVSSSSGITQKHKKKHSKHKRKSDESDTLRIKLDGSFNNTTTYSIRSPMYPQRSEESAHDDDDEGDDEEDDSSADESEDSDDAHSSPTPGAHPKSKPKINPVTGRPLWTWVEGDEGYKRPGSKGKAKKLYHRSIQREDEVLSVGDCAVFLSTARVDRPYIGKVELFWETWNGNMMVKVKWFYHPEEVETAGKKLDLKMPGGLFQSPHTDENDVQTISHKCRVLPLKEYTRFVSTAASAPTTGDAAKKKKGSGPSDAYYLAGSYDPTVMSVAFQTGVLKQ